jgi:ABC-type dipeptide/oligopeptide/nickel transport system permease component
MDYLDKMFNFKCKKMKNQPSAINNIMKPLKTYLILILISTILFMYLGMYNEILIHYKHNQLSDLIGFRVRHLNHNFYTGFFILSITILTAAYLIIEALLFFKRRMNNDKQR